MNARKIAAASILVVFAMLWVHRDAVGDADCPDKATACYQSTSPPCSTGAGTCVVITGTTTVPGGTKKCADGTAAVYYTAKPPDRWTDCATRTGYGNCPRSLGLCERVNLFKLNADCEANQNVCGFNDVKGCTDSEGSVNCNNP